MAILIEFIFWPIQVSYPARSYFSQLHPVSLNSANEIISAPRSVFQSEIPCVCVCVLMWVCLWFPAPPVHFSPSAWRQSVVFRLEGQQQIEDRPWTKSAAVLGLRPRPKAGAAELIVCAAFHLPPVLCYQRASGCWEMIRAGGESQQDVEGKDADRVNALRHHARTVTHTLACTDTLHALSHTTCMRALSHTTFQHSSVVCFPWGKIRLTFIDPSEQTGSLK